MTTGIAPAFTDLRSPRSRPPDPPWNPGSSALDPGFHAVHGGSSSARPGPPVISRRAYSITASTIRSA